MTSPSKHEWALLDRPHSGMSDVYTCLKCKQRATALAIQNSLELKCLSKPERPVMSKESYEILAQDVRDILTFECGCKPCTGQCRSVEAYVFAFGELQELLKVERDSAHQRIIDIHVRQFNNLKRMYETAEAHNRSLQRELDELKNPPSTSKKWRWGPAV